MVLPLVVLTVVMGIFPGPVLERIEPAAREYVTTVQARRDAGQGALPAGGVGRPLRLTR